MQVSLIWAMDDNRLIGVDNALPWKLPADMKWFRQHTLGKPVIMGRKTYESFGGRLLPDRLNIILTREHDYVVEGAVVVHSVDQALQAAADVAEVMVIGGSNIYAQFLPLAQRLYVTQVHGRFEGDAWFPDFDMSPWQLSERQDHEADERNPVAYSFLVYDRH